MTITCGDGSRYGEYVQTYETTDNTLRPWTISAICLKHTAIVQGSLFYYSLVTGRRLHRRKCTPLPMSDKVVDGVHDIAIQQKYPEGLNFL